INQSPFRREPMACRRSRGTGSTLHQRLYVSAKLPRVMGWNTRVRRGYQARLSLSVGGSVRFTLAPAAALVAVACSPIRVPPPPPVPQGVIGQASIPRGALIADIDTMFAIIERVHPDPYTVVSRDSMRRARDAVTAALPDSMSRLAAWSSYARLVALIGDGHTNVS